MTFDAVGLADVAGLPTAEFAFPGRLRDRLVAAILDGSKTSTTGLALEYEREEERLPQVGDRSVLVDSDGRPVARRTRKLLAQLAWSVSGWTRTLTSRFRTWTPLSS